MNVALTPKGFYWGGGSFNLLYGLVLKVIPFSRGGVIGVCRIFLRGEMSETREAGDENLK